MPVRLLSRAAAAVGAAALLVSAIAAAPAHAATPQLPASPIGADMVPIWQTDPSIWALATQGGVLYAGGGFSSVRPPGVGLGGAGQVNQGTLAAFSTASGEFISGWRPFIEDGKGSGKRGNVYTLDVSDDGRTLYVGGKFTHVDGFSRPNVAAFDISNPGSPTLLPSSTFFTRTSGSVSSLDELGGTLYLGGYFTRVNGTARSYAAAVDSSGALTSFAPSISGAFTGYQPSVRSVTATPTRIYLGGMFATVNGRAQAALGVVSPSTGDSVPGFTVPKIQAASIVTTSLVNNGVLYIAGRDDKSSTQNRLEGVMAMDAATGAILWGSDFNRCMGDSFALAMLRGTLFVGSHAHNCSVFGGFPELKPRFYGAVLAQDPLNGRMNFFFPQVGGQSDVPGSQNNVRALATDGDQLFVAGGWLRVNNQPQSSLMRFDATPPGARPTTSFPTSTANSNGTVTVSFKSASDRDSEIITYELLRVGQSTPVATLQAGEVPWASVSRTLTDPSPGAPGTSVRYQIRTSDGQTTVTSGRSSAVSVR